MTMRCHAERCPNQRSTAKPMCERHWRMLPRMTKAEILALPEGTARWAMAVASAAIAIRTREALSEALTTE